VSGRHLAAVVLAAGRGRRLRPLTDQLPKPLCPIANRPLVDLALDRVESHAGVGPEFVAVNAHYQASAIADHVAGRAQVSIEQPEALGTAGALGQLRPWIDGRPVLITNADAYLPAGLAELVDGWDGERIRLLGKEIGYPSDFGTVRYMGACLMPWSAVKPLDAKPTGLYEQIWRTAAARGEIDLVTTQQPAIDCGTPRDYLRANLDASGGESVVGPGAVVEGAIERCVVWPHAAVGAHEHLVEVIRAGTPDDPVTVPAGLNHRDPHES
jgi:MurNAc alpha-1-phosphate uridylyltransferase